MIVSAFLGVAVFLQARKRSIYQEVKTYAEELPLNMKYTIPEKLETKEDKMTALWNLVIWEEDTRHAINKAFGQFTEEIDERETEEEPGILENRDAFYEYAKKKQWKEMRSLLEANTKEAIESLFDQAGEIPGTDRDEVLLSFKNMRFKRVYAIMKTAEEGGYHSAYERASLGRLFSGERLSMDLLYGLYPEEVKKEMEDELEQVLEKHEKYSYLLDNDVRWLERIAEQYQIEIDGLKEARKEVNKKKAADRSKYSSSHSSTSSSKKSSSSGRKTYRPSSSSKDFDNYDIEAYYDDNRDEYDDFDDAYEGFMDDDGAWDDY